MAWRGSRKDTYNIGLVGFAERRIHNSAAQQKKGGPSSATAVQGPQPQTYLHQVSLGPSTLYSRVESQISVVRAGVGTGPPGLVLKDEKNKMPRV